MLCRFRGSVDASDGVDSGVAGLMSAWLLIFGVDFDCATIWVDDFGGRQIVSAAGSIDNDGPDMGIGTEGNEAI